MKDFALIKPVKEGAVMTKSDLVAAIAEKAGIRMKDAEAALNAFIEVVTEALKTGD